MVQLQASPYKNRSDDYLAVASSFSLLMVFFCSIIYKVHNPSGNPPIGPRLAYNGIQLISN